MVPFFGDETEHQRAHRDGCQAGRGKHRREVHKRVDHPDAFDLVGVRPKYRLDAQADGVEQHTGEIPCDKAKRDQVFPFSLMPALKPVQLFSPASGNAVFQLRQLF